MNKTIMNMCVNILLAGLLTSCVNSMIETNPWNKTPVPVVYSVISPNEPVQVYLNQTYSKDYPMVKNPYPAARVYMCSSDSAWIELVRLSPDTTVFKDTLHQLIVEKGKSYSLKVVLPDLTVYAQTTLPANQGRIDNVTCEMLKSYEDSQTSVLVNGIYVNASINHLKFDFIPATDTNSGYYFSVNNSGLADYYFINDTTYQSFDFAIPQDSLVFTLNLITTDPYLNKYILARSINNVTSDYSENSPVLAIIQSFGGVLPQFSNIVNGVGVFGNAVFDYKRVTIKPLAK